MTRLSLVAAFVVSLAGSAFAEPGCRGVASLPAQHPQPAIVTQSVGVAVAGRTLSLWPLGAARLNPDAGVAVTFAGGHACFSTFTQAGRDGIRLDAEWPVVAVELALCDPDGGFCVPVRVDLKR